MITLSLLHPSQSTPVQTWTFGVESVIRIGRSRDNDVVLLSSVVSRKHIELTNHGSDWEIVSLGSNGTFVNNVPIRKVKVQDGMIIRLGSSGPKIQIHLGEGDSNISVEKEEVKQPSNIHDKETESNERNNVSIASQE